MPLSELSNNHVRENGNSIDSSAGPSGELLHPENSAIENRSSRLQGPSYIQSMLKNTTETGDVGQFSIRPPRVPYSLQRTSMPLHGVQQIKARRISVRQHPFNHRDTQQSLLPSHTSSIASTSAISLHRTNSQRSHAAPSRIFTNEDERQRLNIQNNYPDRSLSSPSLHAANRSQGLIDPRGARPRSPFAYPTRLKRPGYRPSSPALSDLNRPFRGAMTSGYRDGPPRTSSPMIGQGARKAFYTRHHGYIQPEPSIRRYPPSPMTSHNSTRTSSPLSTREPTPGPPLSFDQNAFESREYLAPNSTYSGWSRQSHSPSPVFYDYTEAFEESQFQTSAVSLAEQVILENPNTMYHDFNGHHSTTSLIQMPVDGERRNTSSHRQTHSTDMYISTPNIHRRLANDVHQHSTAKDKYSAVKPTLTGEDNPSLLGQDPLRRFSNPFSSEESANHAEVEDREAPLDDILDDTNLHHPAPENPGLVLSDSNNSLASVSRSPLPKESMYSVRSSPNLGESSFNSRTKSSTKTNRSETQPREPFSVTSQSDLVTEKTNINHRKPSLEAVSCNRWSDSEPSQIFAPTPERSMSSPSHRDRFSRIFSIGVGPLDADESDLAHSLVSTGFVAISEMDEARTGNSGAINLVSSMPENVFNALPRTARETHQTVVRSKSEYGTESIEILEDGSGKPGATRAQSQPTFAKSSEQINQAPEAPLPSRLSIMRKPALSLSLPPAHEITEDRVDLNQSGRDSDTIPIVPSLEGYTFRKRPVALLPSMPSMVSVRSCSPPIDLKSAAMPFSFTPLLISEEGDRESDLQGGTNKKENNNDDKDDHGEKLSPPKYKLKMRSDRDSLDSLPSSRPWNLDTSYPWADPPPELDVTMPEQSRDSLQSGNKLPRFKLKIHRPSLSTTGLTKLTKSTPHLDHSIPPKTSTSSEFFRSRFSTQKPRPSVTITQHNSSHSGPVAARFSGNKHGPIISSVTPTINLVPPSPGLNLEVQSFFSDDSSQIPPRGSLRKRFSQLKAIAAKANSTEDIQGTDRGHLTSAMGRSRVSGRSSRQEEIPSERMYNLGHVRWRIMEKIKDWLYRGEKKLHWRGKK